MHWQGSSPFWPLPLGARQVYEIKYAGINEARNLLSETYLEKAVLVGLQGKDYVMEAQDDSCHFHDVKFKFQEPPTHIRYLQGTRHLADEGL